MTSRILMIGWDFPPHTKGGLGVASKGLTDALLSEGADLLFVLPRAQEVDSRMRFVFCDVPEIANYASYCGPYRSSFILPEPEEVVAGVSDWNALITESRLYAKAIVPSIEGESFDVIHAHDWVSYLAGSAVKRKTGKPLVLHVHALSYDQAAGEHVDPEINHIEREAFMYAERIVAVSNRTKQMIVKYFAIPPEKVEVVYNGVYINEGHIETTLNLLRTQGYRVVLCHGRITIQKGPDYFIQAAKRVVEHNPFVIFVLSGSGDMEHQIIEMAAGLGIAENVIFAGPLWGDARDRLYKTADLLVMPSVSEPFGIVPMEALMHGTPVIVSKQSGVAEVLTQSIQVDFWDTELLAKRILDVLSNKALKEELVANGVREAKASSWQRAAQECKKLYARIIHTIEKNL